MYQESIEYSPGVWHIIKLDWPLCSGGAESQEKYNLPVTFPNTEF